MFDARLKVASYKSGLSALKVELRALERKITKALLNKLLQFPEYQRKQLALLLIASTLTDISSKEATELIKEMQK